ncbi:hypothetical protein [Mycobacterium talmoniae]|uniref:Rv0361 family membrane protein n=1 Tax=Mycobacterium talmoniae TaxID=1858794 RepID=UPI001058B28D|nr:MULTISPECIES: hypothetical protein [Mycobacterium]TDH49481.1 hypothetical protein E2F47_20580 [Mycobacterium eburneum]
MTVVVRGFALVAYASVLASGAVVGPPALADPTPPTLDSLEPPAPPAPPAPVAAPNPPPAASKASDEAGIRQVIQASVSAFNSQNWDALSGLYCAAKQAGFSVGQMQESYNESAPIRIAVKAVTIANDQAFVPIVLTDRNGAASMVWNMVRENGWKICGGG